MWKSKLSGPVSDESVRRSAAGMIRNFGNGAARECEANIEKMALHRDASGEDVWRRILLTVSEATGSSVKHAADRFSAPSFQPQPDGG